MTGGWERRGLYPSERTPAEGDMTGERDYFLSGFFEEDGVEAVALALARASSCIVGSAIIICRAIGLDIIACSTSGFTSSF